MEMDCNTVCEKLPWRLNGTLAPEEDAALAAHLQECRHCRGEMEETMGVFELFSTHIPAETLVDLARSDTNSTEPDSWIHTHLKTCASCAEELDLIRQSFALAEEWLGDPPRRRYWPQWFSAAAALAILAMGLGWRQTWIRLQELQSQVLPSGEGTQTEWRGAPQTGFPAVNLFPRESGQRSASVRARKLPPEGKGLSLTLHSQLPLGSASYHLEVCNTLGQKLWHAPLTRQEDGTFTLILPAAYVRPEGLSLRLLDGAGQVVMEHFDLEFQAGK